MLSKHIRFLYNDMSKRLIHNSSILCKKKRMHPVLRTLKILKDDLKNLSPSFIETEMKALSAFPSHTDILVIGGGVIGTSVAYWIREKTGLKGPSVTVIEKDPTFSKSSAALSMGGLRQQFSLPENVQMSLFGVEFLRSLKDRFDSDADVCFTPNGYLTLVGEDGVQPLLDNHIIQKELGALNILLNKTELKQRFSWLNTDDIEMGCLGLAKEGWFDPWSLLNLLKKGATDLGTRFIHAELLDFVSHDTEFIISGEKEAEYTGINEAIVRMPNGEEKSIEFAICVLAAGNETNVIAKKANIGTGKGLLSIPIPLELRNRYVYNVVCEGESPRINMPMTFDQSGIYFRRNGLGGSYFVGMSPFVGEESQTNITEKEFFNEAISPILAERVPAFKSLKIHSSSSGCYEYNYFDQNGILGQHPYYGNIYFAAGFSGQGIQQAPALGRGIAELILDGKYQTIDLTRLGFDRLIVDKPMYELGTL
ncbi:hypothetical protein WA026_007951 [Henosepilachna vigintioctopunctata]|uniref:FAD dependent oxidoreductase domain-containing protein n=1 Tax=Henosepilachna vigintioctopunctata TaxID=420089 RepID=A0AAW1TIC9_9CUCU